MSDFGDTTGMQNPVFKIMKTQPDYFGKYKVIENLWETKYGELLLVSRNDNKLFFLNKIELITNKTKTEIEKDINTINQINSKYVIKIVEYFIHKIEEQEFICIILNYYGNNLFNILHNPNLLPTDIIWKYFIQILFALNSLYLNNILPFNLLPDNIYIDQNNNIKLAGFGISLDILNKNKLEKDLLPYYSPEIIKGKTNDQKNVLWSLGCILYELAFKRRAFDNENYETLKSLIFGINYLIPNDYNNELSLVVSKLICEENKRLSSFKELLFDENIKYKLIETNTFYEILKPNLQGK